MKFECKRCGACCKPKWGGDHSYSAVIVLPHAQERIAQFLGLRVEELKRRYQINGTHINTSHAACTFLEDDGITCSIQLVKPECCDMWPHIGAVTKPGGLVRWSQFCPGLSGDEEENDGTD